MVYFVKENKKGNELEQVVRKKMRLLPVEFSLSK